MTKEKKKKGVLSRSQRKYVLILAIITLISVPISYILLTKSTNGTNTTITAREGLALANGVAHEWNNDSVLVYVRDYGSFFEGECTAWYYIYYSPSSGRAINNWTTYSLLFVDVYYDNTYKTEEIQSSAEPPILNWTVDSDEAYSIAMKNKEIRAFMDEYPGAYVDIFKVSTAIKNAVKKLIGKMSESTERLWNKVARLFGKKGVKEEEELVEDIGRELENGARGEDIEDALDDIRSDSGIAGKPEKEKKLLEAEEYAIKEAGLTGEKAKIFHEVLRRGLVSEADMTDKEFLKKVAEYIKYSDKNPLDAGEEAVVRFMRADGVTTKVGGKEISDLSVLHQKDWQHIKIRHIGKNAEATPFRYSDGRYLTEKEVKNLIEYGLKHGYIDAIHNNDPAKYIVVACKLNGYWKGRGIHIIIWRENGKIITAYPTTAV